MESHVRRGKARTRYDGSICMSAQWVVYPLKNLTDAVLQRIDKMPEASHDSTMSSDLNRENKTALVTKKSGVFVYQGGPVDDSIPDLIDWVREERIREICAAAFGEECVEGNSGALPADEKSGRASE